MNDVLVKLVGDHPFGVGIFILMFLGICFVGIVNIVEAFRRPADSISSDEG